MSNERICVLASHNAHKLAEIRAILADEFDKVLSLKDIGIEVDIDETGTTFEQNAYIKAKAIADLLPGYAVVADDSGLCVPCLNGEPGVYSARYAGEVCDDTGTPTSSARSCCSSPTADTFRAKAESTARFWTNTAATAVSATIRSFCARS